MPCTTVPLGADVSIFTGLGSPERRTVESYESELKALRESEERYRGLFELGPMAVYSCDALGVIHDFNRRAVELWGRRPTPGDNGKRFCGSFKLFDSDGGFVPHEQCPMADVLSGTMAVALDTEVVIERPDRSRIIVIVNIRPLRNQRGEITGAINCFYDVTERREAEQRQRFLMNELEHRGKNLIAVIQSIVSLSLTSPRSLAEARQVLTQRLQALARGQSVLAVAGFAGASVTEIVRLELEGFSGRVKAVGPDIMLNPKVAQTFTFAVHELATNATKYGALSGPSGNVAIEWSTEGKDTDKRFRFLWREFNGPPVDPPTRQGFGRLLLEEAVALDFHASLRMDFAPDGLVYEIEAPLASIMANNSTSVSVRF